MLGFRHGLDYDHIAAISDISSIQAKPSDALHYGPLYVSGHAATVAVLGGAAIALRISLPAGSDRWAEGLVGATLLVLGIYVFGTLFRRSDHHHAKPRTRITLLINAVLWLHWRLSRIFGGTRAQPCGPEAADPGVHVRNGAHRLLHCRTASRACPESRAAAPGASQR